MMSRPVHLDSLGFLDIFDVFDIPFPLVLALMAIVLIWLLLRKEQRPEVVR
jgi:ribose/xylose/arabinose/galactoside ABC-type transport system permease subunit